MPLSLYVIYLQGIMGVVYKYVFFVLSESNEVFQMRRCRKIIPFYH